MVFHYRELLGVHSLQHDAHGLGRHHGPKRKGRGTLFALIIGPVC